MGAWWLFCPLITSLRLGNLGCPEHPVPQDWTLYEDCTTFGVIDSLQGFILLLARCISCDLMGSCGHKNKFVYIHKYKVHRHPDINSSRGQFHISAVRRLSLHLSISPRSTTEFPCYYLASSFQMKG